MAFRRRFDAGLLGWVAVLLLCAAALMLSLQTEGLGAARVVAGLAVGGAVAGLWRHVSRTNLQLARFVESIRFGDLSQNFGGESQGSGFSEVAAALNEAIGKLRDERHSLSDASRFYEAVLDDAPSALLIVDAEGRVELGNKAARRLLVRHRGVRIEDFGEYGETFAKSLGDATVGRPRLVPLMIDNIPQTVLVGAAIVHRLGGLVRVVAVQPIQTELNAVEIAAQSDLIRVLTHEIMNSMTPVTSLAHTAAALMMKVDEGNNDDIADARAAVETLARRADGLMHFVETYRQISRAPKVDARPFATAPWVKELVAIFRASDVSTDLELVVDIIPDDLVMEADPDLLFQVLINLLRNAAEAAGQAAGKPVVSLVIARTGGGRTTVEVSDNGPGVPESLKQDVFLPFFTTKDSGTGVGLSLARQIVLAHNGSISVGNAPSGGAMFRLVI